MNLQTRRYSQYTPNQSLEMNSPNNQILIMLMCLGVYDNLSKYNLPYPEAVFELEYFKENPKPFNSWAKQFFPGVNYLPNTG